MTFNRLFYERKLQNSEQITHFHEVNWGSIPGHGSLWYPHAPSPPSPPHLSVHQPLQEYPAPKTPIDTPRTIKVFAKARNSRLRGPWVISSWLMEVGGHNDKLDIAWLMVWNMNFIFPYIGNLIIPTDFHIFRWLNHQPVAFMTWKFYRGTNSEKGRPDLLLGQCWWSWRWNPSYLGVPGHGYWDLLMDQELRFNPS